MPEFPIRKIALLIGEIRHEGGQLPEHDRMGGLAAADINVWDGLR